MRLTLYAALYSYEALAEKLLCTFKYKDIALIGVQDAQILIMVCQLPKS